MGLDWMLQRKIRGGHEQEAAELTRVPPEELSPDKARETRERLDEISLSPYEAIGCPRIGIDEEATAYLRSLYQENPHQFYVEIAKEPEGTFERRALLWDEVLRDNHGQYVPDLAKEADGIGAVTGVAAPAVSYRGKLMGYVSVLPDELRDRAYTDMTAKQMLDYADQLERCAEKAISQAVSEGDRAKMKEALVGRITEQDLRLDHIAEYHTIHTACRWLRFWGNKGFDMWAWY